MCRAQFRRSNRIIGQINRPNSTSTQAAHHPSTNPFLILESDQTTFNQNTHKKRQDELLPHPVYIHNRRTTVHYTVTMSSNKRNHRIQNRKSKMTSLSIRSGAEDSDDYYDTTIPNANHTKGTKSSHPTSSTRRMVQRFQIRFLQLPIWMQFLLYAILAFAVGLTIGFTISKFFI